MATAVVLTEVRPGASTLSRLNKQYKNYACNNKAKPLNLIISDAMKNEAKLCTYIAKKKLR